MSARNHGIKDRIQYKAWQGEGGKVVVQTSALLLLLSYGPLVGDIDTIQEFPDILIPHPADTLDRRSRLRDVLDVVALEDKLILLRLGLTDGDAVKHVYLPHKLFAQKVADLHLASIIWDDAVDREMCINRTHLVAEALCDTSNHIRD